MGIKKKHVPGCGCCGAAVDTCNAYTDSLAAGTNWTQESGSWTFNAGSGGYVETSSDNAQLIYEGVDSAILAEVPYAFRMQVTNTSFVAGSPQNYLWRAIFNWVDTSNYWYAEAISISVPTWTMTWTIRIGKVVAGVDTALEESVYVHATGTPLPIGELHVCYENGLLVAYHDAYGTIGGVDRIFTNFTPTADAKYGIGTGDLSGEGVGSGRIADFDLTILLDAEDHTCVDCDLPTLPSCPDACEQGYAADEYSLEVAGFSVGTCGDCSAINGTFSLTHATGCVWRSGDIDVCGATHQYRLEIDDTAGIQVFLEQTSPASGDVFSWVATDDGEGTAPWNCLRWTDITLDKDTGDDVPCGTVPATVSLSAVRPF